jgi:hypothetical protein
VILVLFRGITPDSKDYVLKSLVTDISGLLAIEVKDQDKAFKMLGIEDATKREMQEAFRNKSKEIFLDDRSEAWNALEKGVTLDGRFATLLFRACDMLLIDI